jgi:hypothetical protein
MLGSTVGSSVPCRSVPSIYQEINMTKMQLAKHALKLWNVPDVDKQTNRANARKWIRAVERLGDKWVYAKPIPLTRVQ